ncbi:MAG: hypothetical protein ACHQF0_00490 [Chitinophagales bacterium]
MNNNSSLKQAKDIVVRPLAPVIPLKVLAKKENNKKRKVSNAKLEKSQPEFYNKPIYKSKKYDLL